MLNILGIGRSGLRANQFKLDALADEIANVNTDGYKAKKVSFQELLIDEDTSVGTRASLSKTDFSQGILKETGQKWDLAIEGPGFFGIGDENGNIALTRNGAFRMNGDGILTDEKGNKVEVEYLEGYEEVNHQSITVTGDGELLSIKDGAAETVGRITLFIPENPNSMLHLGEGMFLPQAGAEVLNSQNSGDSIGMIHSGFLEGSNADITKAMTEMIVTQRSYSLNAEAVRSTDDLMRLVNELKR
jgi:flagellar basal-body rod protein FlgG